MTFVVGKKSLRRAATGVLFLAAACAPTPGPVSFSSTNTAVIKGGAARGVYLFSRGHVTLTRINDTALVNGDNAPLYRDVEIAAGRHIIYFNYRYAALCFNDSACAMSLSRNRKLALNAEVGHVYRVNANYHNGHLWFWITDQSDNHRVVAGSLPDDFDWTKNSRGFGT